MGKKVLTIAGGVLGILIIAGFILSLTLDGIINSKIQEVSRDLLDTEVHVDNVSVSIFDGVGTIDGLTIQNPRSFEDRPAIQFKQIRLKVDLSTLLSDTVVVENLVIQNPEIYVVQTTGGNNLRTLQTNMSSGSGSPYETSLVIDHLLINEASVHLKSTIGEERNIETKIAQIELTDVGRSGSNTFQQTTQQVLQPVIERALVEAAKEGIQNVIEDKVQDLIGG